MNRMGPYFGQPPRGSDSPELHQPEPILTRVARMLVGGRWVSVVARQWLYGDPARCKLCPRCSAFGGECLLMVAARVSDAEAPLYRIDRDSQRSG